MLREYFSPWRAGCLAAMLAILMAGCAPFDYTEGDAPQAQENVPVFEPAPGIALVLGAGGPRGYAHIGVMRVLEEAGIEIDLIVGSSVGSLLGVFWASGLSAAEIDHLSTQGGPLTLFDFSPFADRGWIRGQRLQDYVNDALESTPIERLTRPVVIAATRRDDKTPVYFVSGNTGVAVRASSAVPGVFSPVGIDGVEYEDGDVSLPVAVTAARAAGAQFVIAVNVYPKKASTPADASGQSQARYERRRLQMAPELAKADFVIHADTPYHASPRQRYFRAARAVGEEEARKRLPELHLALRKAAVQ